MQGALTVGVFYLPPMLMGLTVLAVAGLVATRIRWMPMLAGFFAATLLIASFTTASASVLYRLSHPGEIIGFAEDSLQVAGEILAAASGVAVTVQLIRRRNSRGRIPDVEFDEHVAARPIPLPDATGIIRDSRPRSPA